MFFILSKLFWFFARPLNLIIFSTLAAALLQRLNYRRTARIIFTLAGLSTVAIAFTQLPDWLIIRLEAAVPAGRIPPDFAGIIVLGGGITANAASQSQAYHMGEASDRLVRGLELLRKNPKARLIYSGGHGTLDQSARPETQAVQAIAKAFLGDETTIEYDASSQNTWQNARNVTSMISPVQNETWLLVTSAFHMPRALGTFRAAGLQPVPVPTDFRGDPLKFPFITGASAHQFLKMSIVTKELVGMVAYRLTGRYTPSQTSEFD